MLELEIIIKKYSNPGYVITVIVKSLDIDRQHYIELGTPCYF